MEKGVLLPRDELPHAGQAIEWWYFNGFLESKKQQYAFMTSLFKADPKKINLPSLKIPLKLPFKMPFQHFYFSHTILFNLTKKTIVKESLPIVVLSQDSFKHKDLFINYLYPFQKHFTNYEIARVGTKELRVKTALFDLQLHQIKKPLFEGKTGFLDLGKKSTYYYSYTNLQAQGQVNGETVKGIAWHDKQWSRQGFTNDSWLWFSLMLPNNTQIVCFDYQGVALANISHADGRQELRPVKFTDLGQYWTSKTSKHRYPLSWKIELDSFTIITTPLLKACEMSAAPITYWEGPIHAVINGTTKAKGFLEMVPSRL